MSESEHQRILLRQVQAGDKSFDEYVEGASLEWVIDQMTEYLEALDAMIAAQWRFSQHSKQLDCPEASLISEMATIMAETLGDVDKLHSRALALVKEN